jgi:hypothetical protein
MTRQTTGPTVEPVRRHEHGEQQEDHWVGLQGDEKSPNFDLPRRIPDHSKFGPVTPDHSPRVNHEKWDHGANDGKDQESNLRSRSALA